jgi:hypothetical protein
MLVDLARLVESYIPGPLDYSHSKIWYRVYIGYNGTYGKYNSPCNLEHVRSYKTLRQVYAYAWEDREIIMDHTWGDSDSIKEYDSDKFHALVYENIEYRILKLRPRDIKLGKMIQFQVFGHDSGYIRKIHTNYYEKDYKQYHNYGSFSSQYDDYNDDTYDRSIATSDAGADMYAYPKQYMHVAEKLAILG